MLWCPPAGAVQGTTWLRYLLETAHDAFVGHLVRGGISFYPHARPGAGGVPTSSSGLRVHGCQCPTYSPQFLLLWCSPAGSIYARHRMTPVLLKTVHDAFVRNLVCGDISFCPHARSGTGGVPTPSSGLRVQGCQCATLSPQLLVLASEIARRSATSAARRPAY